MATMFLTMAMTMAMAACSKTASEPAARRTTDEPQPPPQPAAETTDPGSAASADDACWRACTLYGECTERVFPNEHFRGGEVCVESCLALSAAERRTYADEIEAAHQQDRCASLFPAELPSEELELGCLGWSEALHAAVCVAGVRGNEGVKLMAAFPGSKLPALVLAEADSIDAAPLTIDAARATQAQALLAKHAFSVIAGEPTPVEPTTPARIGPLTLSIDRRLAAPGGENLPPTYASKVVARCGARSVQLYDIEVEGADVTAQARTFGRYTLVEVMVHVAREGESRDELHAFVLDASCTVTSST